MFRVGDVRDRKVIAPVVRAVLYTWQGRRTKEGEFLPVLAQPMEINYRDDLMLLPITIEHIIDERSPLYHHTHKSLVACGAEVVVSFEGSIDTTGLSFSARQSYLPNEILWGHTFVRIIHKAKPGEVRGALFIRVIFFSRNNQFFKIFIIFGSSQPFIYYQSIRGCVFHTYLFGNVFPYNTLSTDVVFGLT